MKKVVLSKLSEPVRAFLEQVKGGEAIMVVDEHDRLDCVITPYFEASPAEQAPASERLRAFQQKVQQSFDEQGCNGRRPDARTAKKMIRM
jgi:hypothetical protein